MNSCKLFYIKTLKNIFKEMKFRGNRNRKSKEEKMEIRKIIKFYFYFSLNCVSQNVCKGDTVTLPQIF